MAINACQINGFTLNGKKCRDMFAVLIPILRPPVPPITTTGTNPRVLRDTLRIPRQFELEDDKVLTFEQPIVTVTVEFYGSTGSETQDVSAVNADFVTVTGLEIAETPVPVSDSEMPITVNIFDLNFE